MKCTKCNKKTDRLYRIYCLCEVSSGSNVLRADSETLNYICLDCAMEIYNMGDVLSADKDNTNSLSDEQVEKGIL